MKNILIIGASLYGNQGAAAMAISFIEAINKLGECNVYLLSPKDYYVKNIKSNIFKNVKIISQESGLGELIKNYFQVSLFNRYKNNEILNKYISIDIVFDLSGDGYSDIYKRSIIKLSLRLLTLATLQKDIYVMPQSFGPITKLSSKYLLPKAFSQCKKIYYREKISKNILQQLQVDNIEFFPDLAFFLKPAVGNFDNLFNFVDAKPVIGICANQSICRYAGNEKKYNNFVKILSGFIDSNPSYNYLLLPHVYDDMQINDDRIISKMIFSKVKNKGGVRLLLEEYNARDLKKIISGCNYFIGSRMHSNIASLSSLVPSVAISYSHKYEGIMDILGLREYVINFDRLSLPHLQKVFNKLLANKEIILATLNKKLPERENLNSLLGTILPD